METQIFIRKRYELSEKMCVRAGGGGGEVDMVGDGGRGKTMKPEENVLHAQRVAACVRFRLYFFSILFFSFYYNILLFIPMRSR